MTTSIIIKLTRVISMWSWCWGPNDHCVLLRNFSILWRRKKKDKKTKAFYDWATTGIPVKNSPVHILLYAGNEILYKIKQLLSDYQNQLSRRWWKPSDIWPRTIATSLFEYLNFRLPEARDVVKVSLVLIPNSERMGKLAMPPWPTHAEHLRNAPFGLLSVIC